ncbi:MAG: 50S ribosomal protein L4 [Cyanobacteria bacterium P01_H01_bin.74]
MSEQTVEQIKLKKYFPDGSEAGIIDVNAYVFNTEPNVHVLHQALRRELANARQGSASTKTRAEVRGGGRKPRKQKGTGNARIGSIRSPLLVGGGISHGPKPRSFVFALPKKVRTLAIRSSLSTAADKIMVIDDFSFLESSKTRNYLEFARKLGVENKKTLILVDYRLPENQHLKLATRNLNSVKISLPHNLSVKDLINTEVILASAQAIQEINERYASYE